MADVPQASGGSLNVPSTSTGTSKTLSLIDMVRRAMDAVGSYSSEAVKRTGLEALQDCINDMNIRECFDFTVQDAADQALVENQREYVIPSQAFGIKEVVLVDTSETPEIIQPLGYIDWDQLQRLFRQAGAGLPTFWTARDVFMDRNIQVVRPPDARTVSDWTLRIYYFKGVERPALDDEQLRITGPDVLSTVIQRYIEYRLRSVYGDAHDPRRREAYNEYIFLKKGLRGMENRSRPGGPQIRPAGMMQGQTGHPRRWPGGRW